MNKQTRTSSTGIDMLEMNITEFIFPFAILFMAIVQWSGWSDKSSFLRSIFPGLPVLADFCISIALLLCSLIVIARNRCLDELFLYFNFRWFFGKKRPNWSDGKRNFYERILPAGLIIIAIFLAIGSVSIFQQNYILAVHRVTSIYLFLLAAALLLKIKLSEVSSIAEASQLIRPPYAQSGLRGGDYFFDPDEPVAYFPNKGKEAIEKHIDITPKPEPDKVGEKIEEAVIAESVKPPEEKAPSEGSLITADQETERAPQVLQVVHRNDSPGEPHEDDHFEKLRTWLFGISNRAELTAAGKLTGELYRKLLELHIVGHLMPVLTMDELAEELANEIGFTVNELLDPFSRVYKNDPAAANL